MVSPYAFPGLKYNFLTEDQKKELFRSVPTYKIAAMVLECVAKYFGTTVIELEGKSQKGVLPWARHVFCFLGKETTHLPDRELSQFIKRDRSTVSTHVKDVRISIELYTEYRDQVIELRLIVKNKLAEMKSRIGSIASTHPK